MCTKENTEEIMAPDERLEALRTQKEQEITKHLRTRRALRYGRRKLKKLAAKAAGYPAGAWYDDDKGRYVRYYRGQRSSWIKKQCNRKFRRSYGMCSAKRGAYRKYTEFWWEYD